MFNLNRNQRAGFFESLQIIAGEFMTCLNISDVLIEQLVKRVHASIEQPVLFRTQHQHHYAHEFSKALILKNGALISNLQT